jgi:outer membrane protein assembly factor BamD (BamD/ComL family)
MSKLEDALGRLDRAVTLLEKIARRTIDGETSRHAALTSIKADYATLAATTETVAGRLDAAIGRLDRVLEG